MGQKKAPAMPDDVAVMERIAIGTVPIFNSVRANRIAVPETVATASESMNQAIRKMTICRSLTATLTVFHTEPHANTRYANMVWNREGLVSAVVRGGPGRGRIHSETGIVKQNHQSPTMNRTIRRGSVDDADVLDIRKRRMILQTWTETAAAYPIPTPFDDILF
jgi:hypothetical protein